MEGSPDWILAGIQNGGGGGNSPTELNYFFLALSVHLFNGKDLRKQRIRAGLENGKKPRLDLQLAGDVAGTPGRRLGLFNQTKRKYGELQM